MANKKSPASGGPTRSPRKKPVRKSKEKPVIEEAEVVAEAPGETTGADRSPRRAETGISDKPGRPDRMVPALVVGVVALAIGGGAVFLFQRNAADQSGDIARISAQIAALSQAVDVARSQDPAASAVTQLEQSLGSSLGDLSVQLGALDTRMNALETRPADAAPAEFAEAVGALRADISTLRDENVRLLADLEAAQSAQDATAADTARLAQELAAAKSDLDAARVVQSATQAERFAGPLGQIEAALATGAAYGSAAREFEAITGNPLPAALLDTAHTGVASAARLQAAFPAAARSALRAALKSREGRNPIERSADFLRAQLGARSIAPRAGAGPDAVLSRTQAAVDAGDFDAALAEIDALSPEAQAELADWEARARARIAAQAGFADLVGG